MRGIKATDKIRCYKMDRAYASGSYHYRVEKYRCSALDYIVRMGFNPLPKQENNEVLFKNEEADLLFHYLILLRAKNFELKDIVSVLEERHAKKV